MNLSPCLHLGLVVDLSPLQSSSAGAADVTAGVAAASQGKQMCPRAVVGAVEAASRLVCRASQRDRRELQQCLLRAAVASWTSVVESPPWRVSCPPSPWCPSESPCPRC